MWTALTNAKYVFLKAIIHEMVKMSKIITALIILNSLYLKNNCSTLRYILRSLCIAWNNPRFKNDLIKGGCMLQKAAKSL